MFRIAMIGLGKQAIEDHLPAILESENFDLVAVCDINPVSVEAISAKFKVKGFTDLKELIRTVKCDVASVAVPHNIR